MVRRALLTMVCVCCWLVSDALVQQVWTQQIGRFPVEVQLLRLPAPLTALGRVHLVYELHLTSLSGNPATVERIEVVDDRNVVLASWNGLQLWQRIRGGNPSEPVVTAGILRPGVRAVAYLWVTLQPGQPAPWTVSHRVVLSDQSGSETITTAGTPVAGDGAVVGSPIAGGPWVALRGPSNTSGHRLSLVTIDGRTRVPQRFAVDWGLLGANGRLFDGDRTILANWYGYGASVFAATDGTVAMVRDGRPDRPAFADAVPAVLDAAEAPGNVIVVDIGKGRYATYAHLKAGTLRVKQGDRVVVGQRLADIGNSGNSLGPHLHFQVSDAAEPLAGEGLPFSLRSFQLVGRINSLGGLLDGQAWSTNAAQPARMVAGESPLENMVVRFGS
jgi:murein DD-endopeptidase